MSKVKCAVIGLGMGKFHAQSFLENEDAEIVGLADVNPDLLAETGKRFEVEALFSDYREMLDSVKPDLVTVALPNFLHEEVVVDALDSGSHVLCEKPLAMKLEQGERMREAAIRAGRQLGVNLSYRFTPAGRALKALVDDGFLGEAYHAYTRWTRCDGFPKFGGWFGQKKLSGGGPLIDLGVHRIDLAMWLMGSPTPVTVSGVTHHRIGVERAKIENKAFDVEDFASGVVRFDNGASLILEASWGGYQEKKEDMHTRVMGDKGCLIHQNIGESYDFEGRFVKTEGGQLLRGEVVVSDQGVTDSYGEMVACLKEDRPFSVTVEDGMRIQRVLDGLYASAESGCEVSFEKPVMSHTA
ncbi:Gfo/Idh/MocA family oxidoreductase [Puniceicoccaceae bacterium K14]|nr:Gfo/Idh/MocA family oxidoreductase [Puniceicoccaceae bacterium K14]